MYKIGIYGCAMFKKLVCPWVNSPVTKLLLLPLPLLLFYSVTPTCRVHVWAIMPTLFTAGN